MAELDLDDAIASILADSDEGGTDLFSSFCPRLLQNVKLMFLGLVLAHLCGMNYFFVHMK